MPKFDITIKATIRKTYQVEAADEQAAAEKAHEGFNWHDDDVEEKYTQDTVDIKEILV